MKLEISKEWLLRTLELEQLLISLQSGTGDLAINPEQLIEWEHRAKKFYQKLALAQTEKYEALLQKIQSLTDNDEIHNLLCDHRESRDFPEEFEDENGSYINKCIYCELFFCGYKRRSACKSCEDISNEIKSEN